MYEKTFIREHSLLKHNQFDYIIDETWLFRIFVIVDMRLPLPSYAQSGHGRQVRIKGKPWLLDEIVWLVSPCLSHCKAIALTVQYSRVK